MAVPVEKGYQLMEKQEFLVSIYPAPTFIRAVKLLANFLHSLPALRLFTGGDGENFKVVVRWIVVPRALEPDGLEEALGDRCWSEVGEPPLRQQHKAIEEFKNLRAWLMNCSHNCFSSSCEVPMNA